MKKLVSLAVSLLMAALFCFFTAALAQEPTVAPSPAGTTKKEPATRASTKLLLDQSGKEIMVVRVLKGGNLATIAEACGHRQTDWRTLATANPQLPQPEKMGEMWRVLIQPGQELYLPEGWNYGTLDPEYVVPFPPAPKEVKAAEGTVKPAPGIGAGDAGSNRSLWLLDPMVLAVILLILVALVFLANITVPLIRRRDPSRYPSVIPGGLSDDPTTAVRQLSVAYPGRQYTRIERCRLVRDEGVFRIHVRRMAFGDGISRDVYLNPGDQVYRGTLPGGSCDYFLRSCGNLGPEFELPAGWRVVVVQSQDVDRPASAPAPASSAPAPVPAPASAEPPAPAAEPPATEAEAVPAENPVIDGLKEVAITITDEKGTVLSVAVKGHERALPTKLEKQNGKLVVFFHRDTTA